MKRVHLLTPGFTSPNGCAFLMPLYKFRRAIKDNGIDLHFYNDVSDDLTNCDILCLDSKYFKNFWAKDHEGTLAKIAALAEKTKLVWFHQSDSTGTILSPVLPYVQKYYQAQLLKDKSQYKATHYASRIFGDYYHKKYGITDDEPYMEHVVQNDSDLDKMGISWNSGLMNYGWPSPYLMRLLEKAPLTPFMQFSKTVTSPDALRPHDLTCRMGIPYSRATMRYQREQMREILKDRLPTDKLSRAKYLGEIAKSKICVSPFGLGEITLKDFECFLRGSMLLKPDMSHMNTWPNFFEKEVTYLAHNWDLDDVQDKIEWALSHDKERIDIAREGQNRYIQHTISNDAPRLFAIHFNNIMDI